MLSLILCACMHPQGSDGEHGIQGPPGIRGLPGFKGYKVRPSLTLTNPT